MNAQAEIDEIEARRAAKKAARAEEELAQHVVDLKAREALEDEHDGVALATVSVSRFIPGQPTMALVKTPTPAEYKRYLDQIGRAVEKKSTAAQRAAQELLAQSCWIYPTETDARQSMLKSFPGILTPIAIAATSLAEGKVEDEGKG